MIRVHQWVVRLYLLESARAQDLISPRWEAKPMIESFTFKARSSLCIKSCAYDRIFSFFEPTGNLYADMPLSREYWISVYNKHKMLLYTYDFMHSVGP